VDQAFVSLSQVILKVHSRCDLACDHCYVYEAADQSWKGRPAALADRVIAQAAQRIAEHAAAHALPAVQVIMHGGEPLLAGRDRLGRIIAELQSALRGVCPLDLRIHTNGVLLNENFCELFAEHGVRVGVSLDGGRAANDRHRRYADGRSSYDKVIRAIRLLDTDRFRHLYAGLLCTIDLANDPLVVYESLMDLRPPRIDFLLPHATWDNPPRREQVSGTEYADWLAIIFDRWVAEGRPAEIRTFDSIISTLRGGESLTEALGLGPVGLVVIETDGSYEQVDSLKVAFDGAPETGMNVFDHDLDSVGRHPGVVARQQGMDGLCQTCQECPAVGSCGGGLYTHRYREGSGFANPSVYCADLLTLISHVSSHLPAEGSGGRVSPTHTIASRDFQALAAGPGDTAALLSLTGAQRSLLRGLLGAVYQGATSSSAVPAAVKAEMRGAWSVLATVDLEQPGALDATLGHPYIRAWAVRCLQGLRPTAIGRDRERQGPSARDLPADLGHLGAIAAVAAVHGRMGAAVTIPVMNGAVHLPTLGRLVLGAEGETRAAGNQPGSARVNVISNAVIIQVGESCWSLELTGLVCGEPCATAVPGNTRSGEWQPRRVLRGAGYRVALEDTDPYRDCHQWPAAPRLTDAEVAHWQHEFQGAWLEIEREHPEYAPSLTAGLTALTPLVAAPGGREVSAASRNAFGAVAIALPAGAQALARLVICDFQHVKLGALLDLCDLYDLADDRLFPAPWGEKQQVEGLLQDTYAHLAVTDFWRERRRFSSGPAAETAGRWFERWRSDTVEATETLLGSGALTPIGTSFVQQMRHSVQL
jgi:uncharacterized protein